MAERAHPDDAGFHDRIVERKLFGIFPVRRKILNPYRDALYWRYSIVNAHCREKRVLDIPCGMGWGTSMLDSCAELHGVDISPEAIEEARQRYGEKVTFHQGSMERLDFPAESFDLISCLEGIEHVSCSVAQKFMGEAHRVLARGGLIIVSSPHCNDAPHSGNPYHVYEYQPEEMRKLLSGHFRVEREEARVVDNLTITVFYARKPG